MMKIEKTILFILKVIGGGLLMAGPLMIIGATSSLDAGLITILECLAEIVLWTFITILGFAVLILREALIPRCHKSTTTKVK